MPLSTIGPAGLDSSSANGDGTGGFQIPTGTTAQRPASPTVGTGRWNTTLGAFEVFVGGGLWQSVASTTYSAEVLIVAGGGGGGLHSGGGGGAGGLLYYGAEGAKTPNGPALTLTPGTSYGVTVGAGGAGSGGQYTSVVGNGSNGTNSIFGAYNAIAGGGGGSGGNGINGKDGGSGGGGGRDRPGGVATSGQGFGGGYIGSVSPSYPGGGGGGAGGAGSSGSSGAGGTGGIGLSYSISGTATYYAGGGGGNLQDSADSVPTQGAGGLGGGANGRNTGGIGNAGSANTGGGGGANNYNTSGGGPGGSGIVILRYLGSQRGSGGIVSSASGYTVHTFTSSGNYVA